MTSRLTLSINVQYVKDFGKLLIFLKSLDPYAVVCVIDNKSAMSRVREVRQAIPNAVIVVRCIIVVEDGKKELDGGMHLAPQAPGDANRYVVSPGNFLNEWGELGKDGFILSYMNEPQTTDASPENVARQVQHMIETIGLANQRGISLCVGNWGVGQDPDNDAFLPVFELLSKNRQHILGLHLYAPIDTYQAVARVINRCKESGWQPPRIHVTEFGWDTAGNGDPLNGYKSRMTSAEFAAWCEDKIKNVLRPYIESGVIEAVDVFGWGYAASFPNDDVEPDTGWQELILNANTKGLLDVPTKPVTKPFQTPVPMPSDAGAALRIRVTNTLGINLRSGPSTDYQTAGSLANGQEVTLYQTPFKQAANGQVWRWVSVSETLGGWVCTDVLSYIAVVIPTPPIIVDVPPPDPIPSPPYPEVSAIYAREMAVTYKSLGDTYGLMQNDCYKTAQQWAKLADIVEVKSAA